jgi:cytochrome bd-type quinol oxidase subunit 1
MIKLAALMVLLAAFFLVLTLYIAPQQGALMPSSSISASSINQAQPQLQENALPIQTVDMARQGRSMFMAITLFAHIQIADIALGGSWIIVISQLLFIRSKRKRYERLAHTMAFFSIILFTVGGTFGGAALLYTYSLYPIFMLNIFHIYWWPIFATLMLWGAQIFFLWMYFYTWKRSRPSRHIFWGLGYAVISFFQALAIQTVGSGMLTPNNTDISWGYTGIFTMNLGTLFSWWFNPTLWALQLHRVGAAISFFGFLITVLAIFHYQDTKGDTDIDTDTRKYWDWAGTYGLGWGLAGLAVQPLVGVFYMRQIMGNSNGAFQMLMHGPRAWEMLWMVALFSALIMTSVVYFIDRRETIINQRENKNVRNMLWGLLAVSTASAFILVNPGWLGAAFRFDPAAVANPLGMMRLKYIALAILSVVSAVVVIIDIFILGDDREQDWGNMSKGARLSGIFAGILGMWAIMDMGFVREAARAPWTVWNIIPIPGGTAYPTPISLWGIYVIWVGLIAFLLTMFFYVSKVSVVYTSPKDKTKESMNK